MTLRSRVREIIVKEISVEYLEAAGLIRGAERVAMLYFCNCQEEGLETRNIRRFLFLMNRDGFVDPSQPAVE